jgi:hypothetical protein
MRGRKIKQESRAAELRWKLVAWKQTPESSRPSLRALACELGTSHQLLSHYLDGLEQWEYNERYRNAKKACEEIRTRRLPCRACQSAKRGDCELANDKVDV